MTTAVKVFCDTNILIRFAIAETPEHRQIDAAVRRLNQLACPRYISRQVIREFCSVLTRPQAFPVPPSTASVVSLVTKFMTKFEVLDDTQAVTETFLKLIQTVPVGGKQIHDANIAATMLANGITHLFTLNTEDFKRFLPDIVLLTPEVILSRE